MKEKQEKQVIVLFFFDILDYVNSESTKQVCALCGVLYSGKTTLLKQVIEHLEPGQKEKSLFITCKPESKFTDLYLYICEKIEFELKMSFRSNFFYIIIIQFVSDSISFFFGFRTNFFIKANKDAF